MNRSLYLRGGNVGRVHSSAIFFSFACSGIGSISINQQFLCKNLKPLIYFMNVSFAKTGR